MKGELYEHFSDWRVRREPPGTRGSRARRVCRGVVDNPEKAKQVLADMGCAVVAKEVLCLRLPDRPGELARIMGVFAKLNINVEYSYSLVSTYISISVKDLAAAEEALKEEAVELIDQAQLTALVDLDRSNAQEGR